MPTTSITPMLIFWVLLYDFIKLQIILYVANFYILFFKAAYSWLSAKLAKIIKFQKQGRRNRGVMVAMAPHVLANCAKVPLSKPKAPLPEDTKVPLLNQNNNYNNIIISTIFIQNSLFSKDNTAITKGPVKIKVPFLHDFVSHFSTQDEFQHNVYNHGFL